ncbi:hypothetical protein [Alteromonas sp. a30]|uniref:hypothetical protein n=1 Tax=Alteromonas sp. a30 TaxID=2730917 RepID=UPI002281A860|nr:hypothetical protein [Alteromonas sp. a30]MCY7296838.1 hypothetical protein [Alteromonas sp. a30]
MSLKEKAKHWFLALLIRTKRIKYVAFSANELNEMLADNLPETFPLSVPGSSGELIVESAELSMPKDANRIDASLFCAMHIKVVSNPIYRAHLVISASGEPYYLPDESVVRMQHAQVLGVHLVKDEYALLKDTRSIIEQLTPSPFRGLLSTTFKTTLNLLSAGTYQEMSDYLSIYLTGSKQRIVDFHKPEIEKIITEMAESGDLECAMDPEILEEKLFAQYGKEVKVENGELHFIFHSKP